MHGDTPDDEPTDAEIADDRALAKQVAVAFLANLPYLYDPVAGLLAATAAPIVLAIANTAAVKRLGRRRAEHAADTLLDAADAAGLHLSEFLDVAVSDDRRQELLTRALGIAQDASLRAKRRALGRALANGVVRDEARIDEELLFMRAVEDVDEMHIRLLGLMANPVPEPAPGWTSGMIERADPGLRGGVFALLGTLELHGLIVQLFPAAPIRGPHAGQIYHYITESGRFFLNRLADESG